MIAHKIPVSKSTLSTWLSHIPYSPNNEVVARIGSARARSGEAKSKLKRDSLENAYRLAQKDIGDLTKRDLLMVGIGLYIGEGEKSVYPGIVNSDPRIIYLAIRWFEEVCGLSRKNFVLTVHLYPDSNVADCLGFWSKTTGIPRSQFGKTQIDRRQGKKLAKRGKLKYGTAHLRVKSCGNPHHGVFLLRRIMSWMDNVLVAGLV